MAVLLRKFIGRSCRSRTCVIAVTASVMLFLLWTPIASPGQNESSQSASQVDETPAAPVPICHGDCNGDGAVTIDEIVRIVELILGNAEPTTCYVFPSVSVDAVIIAVNSALRGCQNFTYRLVPFSSIAYQPPASSGAPAAQEPLSGTFVAVADDPPFGDPASLFYFAITDIRFASASFAVTGTRGHVAAFEDTVVPVATVSLNEQEIDLCGVSTYAVLSGVSSGECPPDFPLCEYPPGFEGLDMCAVFEEPFLCGTPMCETVRAGTRAGFSLTLFAVPES